jgi:hypothetical protein
LTVLDLRLEYSKPEALAEILLEKPACA